MGSSNPINIVHAVMQGLRSLRRPNEIAEARGRDVNEIAPRPMLEAIAAADANTASRRAEMGLEEGGGDE
jgi:small subunit ribosomal protein S5